MPVLFSTKEAILSTFVAPIFFTALSRHIVIVVIVMTHFESAFSFFIHAPTTSQKLPVKMQFPVSGEVQRRNRVRKSL